MKISVKKFWHQGIIGRQAKLIYFKEKEIKNYEDFKNYYLRTYPKIYRQYSDKKFIKEYNDHLEYSKKFNGCCKLNETIEIVPTKRPDIIVLSKDWKGKITYHADLEVRLRKDYKFPFLNNKLICEFFEYGRIYIPENDPLALLEGSGSSLTKNSYGIYEVNIDNTKNPTKIEFINISGLAATQGKVIFELI